MPTRRHALHTLSALSATSLAWAQQPSKGRPKRLGLLNLGAGPEKSDPSVALASEGDFWSALSRKGWILGDNIVVERAYAHWSSERLAGLAADLVRKRVDVILCGEEQAIVAAARATRDIAILFENAFLPVEQGFIDSLSRPGRNLTGSAMFAGTEVVSKRLEFLRAIVPEANRLSWLGGGDSWFVETVAGERLDLGKMFEAAAAALGFTTRIHVVPAPTDIDKVLDEVTTWRAQAITAGGRQVFDVRQRLAAFALRHALPVACSHREYVTAGCLLSYGVPRSEEVLLDQRTVEYLDRILRGASPGELPVIQPSRYELVINMTTAKTLGLTIPPSILHRADEAIQ